MVIGSLLALNLSPQVASGTRDLVCQVLSLGCESAPGAPGAAGAGTADGTPAGDPGSAPGAGDRPCEGVGDCLLRGLGQLGVGAWGVVANAADAAWDEVTGVVRLVTQPSLIVDAVEQILADPLGSLRQIVWDDETAALWGVGDYAGVAGRLLWNVGTLLVPGYNAAKAADGLGTAGRVVSQADDVAGDLARRNADEAADGAVDTARRVREDTTLTNVGADIAAPDVLAKYEPGAGFSGAYNPATGEWVALASGDARFVDGRPAPTVPQFGGHAAAERSLSQRTGITDVSENVGFVLVWQGDNTVQIRWNSGTINARNFGDRAAPQQHRQAIVDAVARTTGAVVVE
jgi:hypothetical protein